MLTIDTTIPLDGIEADGVGVNEVVESLVSGAGCRPQCLGVDVDVIVSGAVTVFQWSRVCEEAPSSVGRTRSAQQYITI